MIPISMRPRVTTARLCCDVDVGSLALNIIGTLEGVQLFFSGIVLPKRLEDLEKVLHRMLKTGMELEPMELERASAVYKSGDTFRSFGGELRYEEVKTLGGTIGKVYLTNSSRLVGYILNGVMGYNPTMIGYAESVKGLKKNKAFNDDGVLVMGASYCYGGVEKHVYVGVVADGVSSLEMGFKASSIAIKKFVSSVISSAYVNQTIDPFDIDESYKRAADEVTRVNQHHKHRSATTLTAAVYPVSGMLRVVHVGDTRAYLFYDNELKQLTEDHKVPGTHIITKALGNVVYEPQVFDVHFQPGASLLLASDGAYEIVKEQEIKYLLEKFANPAMVAKELLKRVINRAGGDDASVGIIKKLM
ncbi:MAG: PP2C family protein-serine/threonine phosphatase [Nitrososphaerota archaeon]